MVEIITTNTKRAVQISDEDADLLQFKWFEKRSNALTYIVRSIKVCGRVRTERLHRLIAERMGYDLDGMQVHHRDLDRFNNVRDNFEVLPAVEHQSMHRRSVCRTMCTRAA